jgi:hypothetical protein
MTPKITKEEYLESVGEGVRRAMLTISGYDHLSGVTDYFFEMIKEGTREGIESIHFSKLQKEIANNDDEELI